MKKIILTAVIVIMAAGSLFAERMFLIQGTYLQTNRINKDGVNQLDSNFSEYGLNFTTFNGKNFGFYSSATFLIPFDASQSLNGGPKSSINLDIYDTLKLGLDALVGPGFLAPITPGFSILAAGGLHFNGVAFISSNYYVDSYLKYNLGPGVSVTALLHLTRSLNINISAMGAWDVLEFVTMPDVPPGETVSGGLTWSISAGMGFAY